MLSVYNRLIFYGFYARHMYAAYTAAPEAALRNRTCLLLLLLSFLPLFDDVVGATFDGHRDKKSEILRKSCAAGVIFQNPRCV